MGYKRRSTYIRGQGMRRVYKQQGRGLGNVFKSIFDGGRRFFQSPAVKKQFKEFGQSVFNSAKRIVDNPENRKQLENLGKKGLDSLKRQGEKQGQKLLEDILEGKNVLDSAKNRGRSGLMDLQNEAVDLGSVELQQARNRINTLLELERASLLNEGRQRGRTISDLGNRQMLETQSEIDAEINRMLRGRGMRLQGGGGKGKASYRGGRKKKH
jgi:hypothetical protein